MNVRVLFLLTAAALAAAPIASASAESVSRSHSYFTVGGRTIEQVMKELTAHGPKVTSTGKRHAGASEMQFEHRVGYREQKRGCAIVSAKVSLKATITLPRWRGRKTADQMAGVIWDALASDIRRHEEAHIDIARRHARQMEAALAAIRPQRTCAQAAERVGAVIRQQTALHDQAQTRFEEFESRTVDARIERLVEARLKRLRID